MDNGVSNRVDRHKQLGNAVVPQIPELIGKAIMEFKNAIT
jgi:site-specific DNA-cytosine methylase